MCGRYVSVASPDNLFDEFDVEYAIGELPPPSWNVAPTDRVPMILERTVKPGETDAATDPDQPVRQVRAARWGLVPSWSRDAKGGARMINARIETVTDKVAFKAAAARRRCLVPASGYYEWQKTEAGKVPYFLHDADGAPLAMAGLYELWRDRNRADDDPDRWLWTCTIITQQATDALGVIHDRNPVLVPPEVRASWLDCSADGLQLARRLLEEMPPAQLTPYEVSPAVGNVRNNSPDLIEPVHSPPRGHRSTEPVQVELALEPDVTAPAGRKAAVLRLVHEAD